MNTTEQHYRELAANNYLRSRNALHKLKEPCLSVGRDLSVTIPFIAALRLPVGVVARVPNINLAAQK